MLAPALALLNLSVIPCITWQIYKSQASLSIFYRYSTRLRSIISRMGKR